MERATILNTVIETAARVFSIPEESVRDNTSKPLTELEGGPDSIALVELTMVLEEEFADEVPDTFFERLFENTQTPLSVEAITDAIYKHVGAGDEDS